MRARRGFTLVELLVVAVVGVLLVMATYQVLVINQRTYTIQNEKVRAQQATRAALDVLFNELREVSSRDGDILTALPDSITVRAMRSFGLVCDADNPPVFRVRLAGSSTFVQGDSVFVFADNNPNLTSDDAWNVDDVASVAGSVACTNGDPAQDVALSAAGWYTANTVQAGAPVRAFTTLTYGLFELDGDTYLGRHEVGADWVPIVGPLAPADAAAPGLQFAYRDQNGTVTAVPGLIREIQVTLRAVSQAKSMQGTQVADSIVASVYTRN
jgi:prepilin-type N-terminal cleavage/methylation domain-containing protein